MKKNILKVIAIILAGISASGNKAFAQCSGGVFGANIIPAAAFQTISVPNAGLYYTFSAFAGAIYQFSFCPGDGGSASYDTQITMIDDVTSAYANGYNDDNCGLQSNLTWTAPASGVYRALISRYYCNQNGGSPATLAYRMLPPVNDNCSGAINVGTTSTTTGNTSLGTSDVALPCTTTDGTGGGLWYTVTGDGNQLHATLCGSAFDTRIRVYTGSCGSFSCVAGNDDGICAPQSSVDFCSLTGTTYYILVHGSGSASGNFTLNMSETALPFLGVTQFGYSYCGSGNIQIDASGYSAYNWSPGTGLNTTTGSTVMASPSVTTTYTVTAVDPATGCSAFNNATITVYPVPVVTANATTTSVCSGGASTLTSSGAASYSWNPGNISGSPVTVNPLTTTTYTVTGTSSDGCTNTNTVTINVHALPPVVATSSSPDVCIGSFVTLMASGATTYNWNPGPLNGSAVNATPSSNTTYTVTGTDVNGCVNTNTIAITVNSLPTITATASPDTVCTGNTTTLTAAGGVTYSWSNGPATNPEIVSPSTLTTYTVTGTDANGCVNNGTVTVHALLSGPVTASAALNSICAGSSDVLNVTGATTYNWMPGNLSGSQVTVTPTSTTTYTVTGSTSNGCVKTDSLTVAVNPVPTISANASPASICGGNSSVLTASGGTTYNWSPGNINGNPVSVTPQNTTTYTVTGTNSGGCSNTSTVTLSVLSPPNVSATANPPVSCSGSPTTITATGASTYSWMPGSLNGSSVTVSPSTSTTYTVTGTSANGCINSFPINIAVAPPANLIVYSSETSVCQNDMPVFLYGIPSGGTWSGAGVSGNAFSPSAGAGTHVCTYTYQDQYGCTSTATTSVFVNACVGIQEHSGLGGVSFYPNPNEGTFTIAVSSADISTMKMEIIDLQGRVVYAEQLNGISSGFAKTINMTGVADGAYYLRFTSSNSTTTQKLIIQH
jgi:hypothetical protein